ncbi:hypothetical protein OnM2_021093 [Erysiphe neolycopersici]|uniref:Uncharacterized protein n=1 Tax=Erysiphe neolycopersici TaxID=212602 RepID=A0A420I368_9PEZI|nr:hypothetical protein OnM2_021093 [Erysiphe neolycopersici]
MRLNIFATLFTLFFAIWAEDNVPPPDEYTTRTLTSTTTITHTVTVSLTASVTMTHPIMNNTLPTGAYPIAPKPHLDPFPTATEPDGHYNVPIPPKETAPSVPHNGAGYVMENKALLGVAGLVAILAVW